MIRSVLAVLFAMFASSAVAEEDYTPSDCCAYDSAGYTTDYTVEEEPITVMAAPGATIIVAPGAKVLIKPMRILRPTLRE